MRNHRDSRLVCDRWYHHARSAAWIACFLVQLLLFLTARPASCRASVSIPEAPGIEVFPAHEVLADHTTPLSGGELVFRDAAGAEIPLIREVQDPRITNRGDGTFHPADEEAVLAAISEIPHAFLAGLRVDIYLLPYPRSGMLSSSADDRAIYITPGVTAYRPAQLSGLIAHELGHCAHRRFLPDTDRAGWRAWAVVRGTADSTLFQAGAPHASRPHEIFAEDFRALFGGALACGDGSVENAAIQPPESVPGLRAFYLALAGQADHDLSVWSFWPNPLRDGAHGTLRVPEEWPSAAITAELFDAMGRMLAAPDLRFEGPGAWSVKLSDSRTLPRGAYWLRLSSPGRPPITLALRLVR